MGESTEKEMLADFREIDAAKVNLQVEIVEPPTITTEALRATARQIEKHWAKWSKEQKRTLLQASIKWIVVDMAHPANSRIEWNY